MSERFLKWAGKEAATDLALAAVPIVGEVRLGRRVAVVVEATGKFLSESRHLRGVKQSHDFARIGSSADEVVDFVAKNVDWQDAASGTKGVLQMGEHTIGYSLGISTRSPGEVILNAWIK